MCELDDIELNREGGDIWSWKEEEADVYTVISAYNKLLNDVMGKLLNDVY